MAFTDVGQRIWPVTPDWTAGVQESLAWSTDVMWASATAVSQHRALCTGPRRAFTFEVLAGSQERRAADMLLAGHAGAWLLPIWPDVQWLSTPVSVAAEEIACRTAGFDFVESGLALLYDSLNVWEVVEIDTIEEEGLVLVDPTVAAHGVGARLYPLRRASVQDGAEERLGNHNVGRRSFTFDIDEPCDWPELDPATYLGHPVLDVRPDETDDPTSGYEHLVQTVDYGTGLPFRHDLPGLAMRVQQSRWQLFGREQHSWFRSLAYTLRGRHRPIWVPSFAVDLQAAAAIAGGSTALSIEWAGYTLFGLNKPNRQDIRIHVSDGTAEGAVLYRRIVDAVEAGATETLTLDEALDAEAIPAARIRSISFMTLSTLAADEVEIEHQADADGVAQAGTSWQAVVPDV